MTKTPKYVFTLVILLGICQYLLFFVAGSWFYTMSQLENARRQGIYPTAEAGMRQLVSKSYQGIQKVEIDSSGPNSPDGSSPHVWFVVAKVWAEKHGDGSRLHNINDGPDFPGTFFLHLKDGWVQVGEGNFPEFIGFWMKVFGWDGGK